MILVRRDIAPPGTIPWFDRTLYLIQQMRAPAVFFQSEGSRHQRPVSSKQITFRKRREVSPEDETRIKGLLIDVAKMDALDGKILERLRGAGVPSFQILDPNRAPAAVDHIIRPFFSTEEIAQIKGRVLAGPRYALLHHSYRHFHKKRTVFSPKIRRVFVNLSRVMPYRLVRQLIEMLIADHYRVKIRTPRAWRKAHKKALKNMFPTLRIVGSVNSLARCYFESDIVLVDEEQAGLEAACVGTPFLFLSNQPGDTGLIEAFRPIGRWIDVSQPKIRWKEDIRKMLPAYNQRERRMAGENAKTLVDGKGVWRVVDFLRESIKI